MERAWIVLGVVFLVFLAAVYFVARVTYLYFKVPYVPVKVYFIIHDPFTIYALVLLGGAVMAGYALKQALEASVYVDEDAIADRIRERVRPDLYEARRQVEKLEAQLVNLQAALVEARREAEEAKKAAEMTRIELQYLKKYALGLKEE